MRRHGKPQAVIIDRPARRYAVWVSTPHGRVAVLVNATRADVAERVAKRELHRQRII